MDRLNIRVPSEQLEQIEREAEERGFPNRSEFMRHLIREALDDA